MDKISQALAALSQARQDGDDRLLAQIAGWLSRIGIDVNAYLQPASPQAQPPQGQTLQAAQAPQAQRSHRARRRNDVPAAVSFNIASWERLLAESSGQSTADETDYRLAILNSLLRCPQGDLAPVIPLFARIHDTDPLFFGHLAAWYYQQGSVLDLKLLFIAFMVSSRFSQDYRQTGVRLLFGLPPYQVERVVALVKGRRKGGSFIPGIVPCLPRSLRRAVEHYLRVREGNEQLFDSACLQARRSLKTLYASLRIKPSAYAQRVLFEGNPPQTSRLKVLSLLAGLHDPEEQARLIVENKLPYRVAVGSLRQITPSILAALVWVMTPQEMINNMASLQKRGAMQNPDLRKLIEARLEQAKTDMRVSGLKTRLAAGTAQLDEQISRKVEEVGDAQIKSRACINQSTALLIDKSGSMDQAIAVGKEIAAIIAPVCKAELYVYAFDSMAYPVGSQGVQLSDWERALAAIRAGGQTSCGVAVEMMRRAGQTVEQIIIVTDQDENCNPRMSHALYEYAAHPSVQLIPRVIIVNVGRHSNQLENSLKASNIEVDTFTFSGDYRSLPNLIPLLSGGSRLDLLTEIMNCPLLAA
jgi:hypothetical protein